MISAAFTGSLALMALTTLDKGHVQPEIVDAWSVVEVRAKTGYLLDWLARHGVSPAEMVVDITGGTSIMSAGAFSVAAERGIDCQYVRSDYDENNRPKPNTQRGVFVTRYETERWWIPAHFVQAGGRRADSLMPGTYSLSEGS